MPPSLVMPATQKLEEIGKTIITKLRKKHCNANFLKFNALKLQIYIKNVYFVESTNNNT